METMTLEKVMKQKNFVVLGDTLSPEKYAFKIKNGLLDQGCRVAAVGKELASLNDVDFDIDVIDLCINPHSGLRLLRENRKKFKCIVIQPGASNEKLLNWLNENHLPYFNGCLLLGLSAYAP